MTRKVQTMKYDRLQLLLILLEDLFQELDGEDFKNCLAIHDAIETVNNIIEQEEKKQ